MNTSYSSLQFLLTYNLNHIDFVIYYEATHYHTSIYDWIRFLDKNREYLNTSFSILITTDSTHLFSDINNGSYSKCGNQIRYSDIEPNGDPYKPVADILKQAVLKTNVIKS